MIENLITIILVELIIVLAMWIVGWLSTFMFYEEPEPPATIYQAEISDEELDAIKKLFEEHKDD